MQPRHVCAVRSAAAHALRLETQEMLKRTDCGLSLLLRVVDYGSCFEESLSRIFFDILEDKKGGPSLLETLILT